MNSLSWEEQKAFFALGQRVLEFASYLAHDFLIAAARDNNI